MKKTLVIAMLFLPLLTGSANAMDIPGTDAQVKPMVEKLMTNHLALKTIYRDMHELAQEYVNESDTQFSYIQKVYLFVNEARLTNYYLWRLTSIIPYIQDTRKRDFYSLRAADLEDAAKAAEHTVTLLKLYQVYINYPEVKEKIDEAVGIIEGNRYLYRQFLETVRPILPQPAYPNRLESEKPDGI